MSVLWGIVVLIFLLKSKTVAKLRDFAEKAGKHVDRYAGATGLSWLRRAQSGQRQGNKDPRQNPAGVRRGARLQGGGRQALAVVSQFLVLPGIAKRGQAWQNREAHFLP